MGNDNPVSGVETWSERHAPVKFLGVNYTYRISRADGGDVISHRIDYEAPGSAPGSILYGNFTPQHDFDAFKEAFFALPEACQSSQVMTCADDAVEQIERTYFKHNSWLRDLKKQQQ